jgi:PBSX family phage terminase large subunit
MMTFNGLSPKQAEIAKFGNDEANALICDGAVRSGKTSIMMGTFVLWAMMYFDGRNFGICGRAVHVAERNIIKPFISDTAADPEIRIRYLRSQSMMIVEMLGHTNYFYLFGGKDEASYTLIQGITLSGILFDEVALMPRSFVEQGITRTLSVDNAKLWFNCNPESPSHWFYEEWIKQPEKHGAKYLHFLMTDNPGLSPKAIERAASSFSGVFYDRYILGKWVKAEGLIYAMFDPSRHVFSDKDSPFDGAWYISIDYGTQNPFAALLWRVSGSTAYCMGEYYYDGKKTNSRTDEEHAAAIKELIGDRQIHGVFIDPSAASMRETLGRHGIYTRKANNDVVPGISDTATALQIGRLRFHESCKNTIREFGLYSWDAKAAEDKPMKEQDHAMDAVRYFVHSHLRHSLLNLRTGKDV